jgi:hypothetical protein
LSRQFRLLNLVKIRSAELGLNALMQKRFNEHRRLEIEIHLPLKLQMPFELSAIRVVLRRVAGKFPAHGPGRRSLIFPALEDRPRSSRSRASHCAPRRRRRFITGSLTIGTRRRPGCRRCSRRGRRCPRGCCRRL